MKNFAANKYEVNFKTDLSTILISIYYLHFYFLKIQLKLKRGSIVIKVG